MTNNSYPILKVYVLLNKILNSLVKKKYGSHYSIRLNSLCFMSKRNKVFNNYTSLEQITLKSFKPISLVQLNLIKDFLLYNMNSALMCIDSESYIEVIDIELVII